MKALVAAFAISIGIFTSTYLYAEIPNPTLSEKDVVSMIDALATKQTPAARDFIARVEFPEAAAPIDSDLESQWRGNKSEHSSEASVELWLSVPSSSQVGPLALSQTVIMLTFDGESVIVRDSTAQSEQARNGIKIPILARPRLFNLNESGGAAVAVMLWPRIEKSALQASLVCPDRSITRADSRTPDGYAGALGEQLLVDGIFSSPSISPYRSLFRLTQESVPAAVRRFVAARFGFRGEAAAGVLSAIRPALAQVSVQTAGQLTKAVAQPDNVNAPNPNARLQYISTPQESVLSDATQPLGATVEFRTRVANPAGFEREVFARSSIATRRIDLPRSVANTIGFGEAENSLDWNAGECL